MSIRKGFCEICNTEIDIRICCNSFDCGCAGLPIDPPVCSSECYDKMMSKITKSMENENKITEQLRDEQLEKAKQILNKHGVRLSTQGYENKVLTAMLEFRQYHASSPVDSSKQEEIDRLKGDIDVLQQDWKVLNDDNKQLQSRIYELQKGNEKHIESLKYIRDNPKTWKTGGIGGQDEYAGLPPMLRYIDEIIDYLTNPKTN